MMKSFNVRPLSRLGASPGYVSATKPWLAPKRLTRSDTLLVILQEMSRTALAAVPASKPALDAEAAEVLETIRGLV